MPRSSKTKRQAIVSDPDIFWMIRRKKDGLFADGKSRPHWSKTGKAWYGHSRLLTHFKLVLNNLEWYQRHGHKRVHPYLGCEIVQFRRTEEAKADFENYGQ